VFIVVSYDRKHTLAVASFPRLPLWPFLGEQTGDGTLPTGNYYLLAFRKTLD
jgi:hypothetical protein